MKAEIRTLQEMLRLIASCVEGIPTVIPDGVFGTNTERAVRAFQKQAGLPVTGMVDETTWRMITEAYQSCLIHISDPRAMLIRLPEDIELKTGDQNIHIYLMQAMMIALAKQYGNLSSVTVNGILDQNTVNAVKHIQILVGIEPNGIMNRLFWDHLVGLYMAMAKDGTNK